MSRLPVKLTSIFLMTITLVFAHVPLFAQVTSLLLDTAPKKESGMGGMLGGGTSMLDGTSH